MLDPRIDDLADQVKMLWDEIYKIILRLRELEKAVAKK